MSRVDYVKRDHYWQRHHKRFRRFVEARRPPLVCQECGGTGGEMEPLMDDGSGPFMPCGFCEGLGLTTPHLRGVWLQYRRQLKAERVAP